MRKRKAYHHGNLRQALLGAARETIRTQGAAGLTLRGVAGAANVSHAAPYHHFKDKDALLAGVAEEGFHALRVCVIQRTTAAGSPTVALQEAAVAYVVFAVENPELFRIMFGPLLSDKTAYPSLQAASRAAYRTIEDGLEQIASNEEGSGDRAGSLAAASWAIMHGLAMLLIDMQFDPADVSAAEDLSRKVTDVLWLGLSHYFSD